MSATNTKTAFGRICPPRDAWLATAADEPIIDPDLPIIDTHHHLWHRRGASAGAGEMRYLLDEFLADCNTGHNVIGSVFLQCHAMHRNAGPAPMRPVGETEFVAGIAAMSDSGGYGRHAGKQAEVFAEWKTSVNELATCPNVTMKLGGMMMRLAALDYMALDRPPTSEELANHWRPYVATCIELFGADRCMAESNFPVEKMGIGFASLFNALKRIAAGCSADEKVAIFADTARRVYRLDC